MNFRCAPYGCSLKTKEKISRTKIGLVVAVFVVLSRAIAAQEAVTDFTDEAKGIFLEGMKASHGQSEKSLETARRGIQFHILLLRGGTAKEVSSTFPFHDGDRMRFEFELNQDSYVYVLNRTIISGFEAGGKGIEVVPGSFGKDRTSPYHLIFPTDVAGDQYFKAGKQISIPKGDASFRMDTEPGSEQLLVLMSATPLDISKYLDKGFDQADSSAGSKAIGAPSDQDKLALELADMEENTEVSYAKGIRVDSYGISRDSKKPAAVTVNLKHLPRSSDR